MEAFDYTILDDPRRFAEHRMPGHSDHRFFDPDGAEPVCSLNGDWFYRWSPNVAEAQRALAGFERSETDCTGWDTIRVPGHVELQGHGAPQYVNIQYPWDGAEALRPGDTPTRYNPVSTYVRSFTLPERFRGRRVYLSFQGAESALAVWLNGTYIGFGEDAFTPSEFEVTDALTEGENKLAVQVFRYTCASWCEDQDFFRFSGLFRDVLLYAIPRVHVFDLDLRQSVEADLSCAALRVTPAATAPGRAVCTLFDGSKAVARVAGALDAALTFRVPHPRLWSAEEPTLYRLEIEVLDADDVPTERIEEQIGFRRFEIRDGLMLLNGRRIVFRGVNRHEFSAQNGRCVTEAETERDIITMKRNNINAIRCSHYPNQTFFYRLCDRYGLYVIDETNLEAHGSWSMLAAGQITNDEHVPGDNPDWEARLVSRAESMLRRDRNHACVLIWSCGNESYGGTNFQAISRYFHRMDDRPVHYEGATVDTRHPEISDIFSNMYFPAEEIRDLLARDSSKPAISCEYGHAMGNSFGGQDRYIRLSEEVPAYQGGFIWDYIDQALLTRDRFGQPYLGYGGDFDDRPCDYDFSGDGLVYADTRVPSPKMQEVKYLYQPLRIEVGRDSVTVRNRSLFTNSAAYACRVTLAREGKTLSEAPLATAAAPGAAETYPLPLSLPDAPGEYTVTVSFHLREDTLWAEKGHEIAFGQGVFGQYEPAPGRIQHMEIIEGGWNIGFRGEEFQILFSKLHGGLISYRYKGRELLQSIPAPNFWRAPTANDRGNFLAARRGQWKLASQYLTAKEIPATLGPDWTRPAGCRREGNAVIYTYLMPTAPQTACTLRYTVEPDGTVEATLESDAPLSLGAPIEFGLLFKMRADCDRVRWYGLGPAETYADRKQGAKLSVYENRVADNMAGYLVPQECGAKQGVRWASVTDEGGLGLLFMGDGMQFSALPYTPFELENAAHPHELSPAHYTVIRAALGSLGVGGDDSWGRLTLPQYELDAAPLRFTCRFRAVDPF